MGQLPFTWLGTGETMVKQSEYLFVFTLFKGVKELR